MELSFKSLVLFLEEPGMKAVFYNYDEFFWEKNERTETKLLNVTVVEDCCQVNTELTACILWTVWTLSSDLRAKARRWDEKQLGQLKNRKEKLSEELKEWVKKRRKESELSTMRSQIKGYETRLKYSVTDRDNLVSLRVQGSSVWLWKVILSIYYLTVQVVIIFEIFFSF